MEPALVLERFLDALAILDPTAHASLTASRSIYATIPAHALADSVHEWWGSEAAIAVVETVIGAVNRAAPEGFACVFSEPDRFELAREGFGETTPGSNSASPSSISALLGGRVTARPIQ